jgi:hypothetical protein
VPAAEVVSSTTRTAPVAQPPPPSIAPTPSTTASTGTATNEPDSSGTPYEFLKEGIPAAIHEKMPEIRECADAWLRHNPKLEGRMLVAFDITPDDAGTGEVTGIELIDGGVGQPFMEGCILNVFQDIRFVEPPGGGKVRVRYPIRLEDKVDESSK